MKLDKAIQDYYPLDTAICYGCGRNNPDGLHIKSYWDGTEGLCRFTPFPAHTAFPGIVYGGILASLVDCHTIGTAIAAMYQQDGRHPNDGGEEITCVTGKLEVNYLKPTPHGEELLLRATIAEISERKALITCRVFAGNVDTIHANVIAVRVPSRLVHGGHYLKRD
jgi:acyl-coenzyme A thioesterase PaaI-like protein